MSELSKIKKAVDDKGCAWEALTKSYLEKSSLLRVGHEQISARYEELRQEKERLLHENGRIDAAADDVIEINAGGELIVVTRRTLTQIEGSLLEALFSGRWEKKLLRDEQGRVFLDINSASFRAIVDYLTELNISSPDSSVPFPLGDDDTRSSLDNTGTFFGLKGINEKNMKRKDNSISIEKVAVNSGVGHKQEEGGRVEPWQTLLFTEFPNGIKLAFEREQAALNRAKIEFEGTLDSFQREKRMIGHFLGGNSAGDIVHLNVSGVKLSTRRSTLGLCPDSVLAKQFNDPKWNSDGGSTSVRNWPNEKVVEWAWSVEGIPKHTVAVLRRESITGAELLAMEKQDFKDMGIHRTGTLALLMNATNELKRLHLKNREVFVEQSPYCFGKMIDQLRIRSLLQAQDVDALPPGPFIRDSEEERFKKVLDYYFPGDLSDFIRPVVQHPRFSIGSSKRESIENPFAPKPGFSIGSKTTSASTENPFAPKLFGGGEAMNKGFSAGSYGNNKGPGGGSAAGGAPSFGSSPGASGFGAPGGSGAGGAPSFGALGAGGTPSFGSSGAGGTPSFGGSSPGGSSFGAPGGGTGAGGTPSFGAIGGGGAGGTPSFGSSGAGGTPSFGSSGAGGTPSYGSSSPGASSFGAGRSAGGTPSFGSSTPGGGLGAGFLFG